MLPAHRQFSYFNQYTCHGFAEYMSSAYPSSKPLFAKANALGYGDESPDMAFHEFAHLMDVVNRGKPETMWLSDFGFPRKEILGKIWKESWSFNELWVGAAGTILFDRSGAKNAMIRDETIAWMVARFGKQANLYQDLSEDELRSAFVKKSKEYYAQIEPVIDDLANRTIEYMLHNCPGTKE